jgi:hypothetical protein
MLCVRCREVSLKAGLRWQEEGCTAKNAVKKKRHQSAPKYIAQDKNGFKTTLSVVGYHCFFAGTALHLYPQNIPRWLVLANAVNSRTFVLLFRLSASQCVTW